MQRIALHQNKFFHYLIIFIMASAVIFTSCNNQTSTETTDQTGIPPLHERKGELSKTAEWEKTKAKVAELKEKIIQNPNDVKSRLQIAMIYMSEARITGDAYYHQSTIDILDGILKIEPNNFEATTFKSSVAMSLHRFEEAKKLAEKARTINPDNAYVYGVLVDANVELGNYEEAVAMSDKMQALKPSLESYSRASYLREIYGDYNGAIEAMQLAVQAGAPGTESAEWARVALGDLYLNVGQPDKAKEQYEMAQVYRPSFPNAEIGLAKVERAKKNYDAAIAHTEKAIRIVSETAYVSLLGELYELKGNTQKAAEIRNDVIGLLEDGEKAQENVAMKHNANRELARAYMDAKELDKALQYAKNDLAIRPDNIDANELVAWIYYMQGNYDKARTHADKMLATNTKNANTLYKAGMIYKNAGDAARGDQLTLEAKTVNPYIDQKVLIASN